MKRKTARKTNTQQIQTSCKLFLFIFSFFNKNSEQTFPDQCSCSLYCLVIKECDGSQPSVWLWPACLALTHVCRSGSASKSLWLLSLLHSDLYSLPISVRPPRFILSHFTSLIKIKGARCTSLATMALPFEEKKTLIFSEEKSTCEMLYHKKTFCKVVTPQTYVCLSVPQKGV